MAGIFGSLLLKGLAGIAGRENPHNELLLYIAETHAAYFVSLGIFVAAISILMQRRRVPEKPREIFDIIDEARTRKGITELQHRQAYLNVISKVVASFPSAPEISAVEAKDLADDAIADTEDRTN
jgi:hypothetical protein